VLLVGCALNPFFLAIFDLISLVFRGFILIEIGLPLRGGRPIVIAS
jgi:hypothetical protein